MKIKNAKFLKSGVSADDSFLLPEIAIVGRSNVGKSSLINYLTNSKIAKTSSTPGRTRLINYFEINGGEFILVDLPGYGYAEANKSTKSNWGSMIEPYILNNKNLKNILLLVDCRHTPSTDDKAMMNFLLYYNLPFTIVATKVDKLKKSELNKNLAMLAQELKVGIGNIYPVSATKRVGIEKLTDRIFQFIGE
mgnify:FL=1